jgi:Nuclease-related domain
MSQWGGPGADPGRGAREQAARAAAQVREAQEKLDAAMRRQASWTAGAEGEQRTAAELARLAGKGWQVLHDVHWPGRPFANIDHIAVGPAGVVVIDSKNWSGPVEVPKACCARMAMDTN